MIELKGKYTDAKIFTDVVDNATLSQIQNLINQEFMAHAGVRIMPDCHAGTGCTIGTVIKFKDKMSANLTGVDISCLDKDTEVLTPRGWIKISEYDGSEILVYNYLNDSAYFEIPYAYIKEPCKEFIHFKSQYALDQMLSFEHKMLIWKGFPGNGRKPYIDLAKNVADHISSLKTSNEFIKTTFNYINNGFYFIRDIDIRIGVMIAADGYIHKIYDNIECTRVRFHFQKERKINRCIQLLSEAGYVNEHFHVNNRKDGTTEITVYIPRYISKELHIQFRNLNSRQFSIMCDELFYWDGTIDENRNHKTYCTTNKLDADFVQFAFACIGIRAGIFINYNENNPNHNIAYHVYITNSPFVNICPEHISYVKSIDGYKYCFTTSTGFFIIRRNNNISITGNCGMHVVYLGKVKINFEELDKVIRAYIPSGRNIHERSNYNDIDLKMLYANVDIDRACRSIGTLGGGNHFIEIDVDKNDNYYLIIHTGSRYLGLQVCKYYQDLAWEKLKDKAAGGNLKEQIKRVTEYYKSIGKQKELSRIIKELKDNYKAAHPDVPYELAYLEGDDLIKYLMDTIILNKYARDNREAIGGKICKEMKWKPLDMFHTVHNYIDAHGMIVRKGAISAKKDELAVIPINMRDGTLLVKGKGNPDWLESAPHGAGRIMSRNEAKNSISMKDFKDSMEGIYTTCINTDTVDESCFAYKRMEDIVNNIQDTVEILEVLKPVYNFKAGGE